MSFPWRVAPLEVAARRTFAGIDSFPLMNRGGATVRIIGAAIIMLAPIRALFKFNPLGNVQGEDDPLNSGVWAEADQEISNAR